MSLCYEDFCNGLEWSIGGRVGVIVLCMKIISWIRVVDWWSCGCYCAMYEDFCNGLEWSIGGRVGVIDCMKIVVMD